MYNAFFGSFFTFFIPTISWLMSVTFTAMLGGILVKLGEGHGKIIGSDLFQNKHKLFIFFILEVILLSFLSPLLQSLVFKPLLVTYSEYLISIFVQFYIIVFVWFLLSYGFKIKWKPVLVSETIVILWGLFMFLEP